MKSYRLKNPGPDTTKWMETATPEQIDFVDQVYAICEENYESGGDNVVECYGPRDILFTFDDIQDVQKYCGLMVEQELNCRWGENDDPELQRHEDFKNSNW